MTLPSNRTQLVLTALAASLTTAALISAYNVYSKRERRRNLNEDILRSLAGQDSVERKRGTDVDRPDSVVVNGSIEYGEELIREQLGRNYAFFGEDSMRKIRGGSVVIVGCGGVGSWAAVMLARSYVRTLRIISFHLSKILSVEYRRLGLWISIM